MRVIFIIFLLLNSSFAYRETLKGDESGLRNVKSPVLDQIGIDEKLGNQIDLNNTFKDELGNDVKLGKYFKDKPVFMILIYYECPTLCNLHLNALVQMLSEFEWKIGEKFEFVAVSIDSGESSKLAEKKLESYLKEYGHPQTRDGWHFLTGERENIDKLANQIGFKFAWDPSQQQWAHSAAAYVLTPKGKISYYHYGLNIEPKIMRLSLVEAANNKIGNIVDRMVLFCLQYDPNKKTYAFYAMNVMRVAGVVTIIFLFIFFFKFWRKENKREKVDKEDKN